MWLAPSHRHVTATLLRCRVAMQAGSHSDRTSKKRPVDLIVSLGRPRCAVHRSWLQRSWLVSLDLEMPTERIQAHVHRPSPTLHLSARKRSHTPSGLAAVSQHRHRPVTGRASPSTPLGPSSWGLSVVSWSVWAAARAMDVVPLPQMHSRKREATNISRSLSSPLPQPFSATRNRVLGTSSCLHRRAE
jgi:hypothetical protein